MQVTFQWVEWIFSKQKVHGMSRCDGSCVLSHFSASPRQLTTSVSPNHHAVSSSVSQHVSKRYWSLFVGLQETEMTYLAPEKLYLFAKSLITTIMHAGTGLLYKTTKCFKGTYLYLLACRAVKWHTYQWNSCIHGQNLCLPSLNMEKEPDTLTRRSVRNSILLHLITITLSRTNLHFTHTVTLVHAYNHMSYACPGPCTDSVGI